MRDAPEGFRLYAPVLQRIGADFRPQGGGLTFRCVFGGRHKHGDRNPSAFVKLGERGELVAHCNGCGARWKEFVEFVGLPASAWWPRPPERRMDAPKSKPVAHFDYKDRGGNLYAVKTRWEPGFDGLRPKDFTWRRPVPAVSRDTLADQGVPREAACWVVGKGSMDEGTFRGEKRPNGEWWFRKVGVDPRCPAAGPSAHCPATVPDLYRLPELLAADRSQPVFVAEGERKADRLAGLGFVAVSGPHGSSKFPLELAGWLSDRRVVAVPDCDRVGVEFMLLVLASCVAAMAAEVRWVDLPNPDARDGYDVLDWLGGLSHGEARQRVIELCKSSPVYRRGV